MMLTRHLSMTSFAAYSSLSYVVATPSSRIAGVEGLACLFSLSQMFTASWSARLLGRAGGQSKAKPLPVLA